MNYIEYVNLKIRSNVSTAGRVVVYGQNVAAGSCVSGLAKGLKAEKNATVLNTINAENTLVGVGLGLLLNGVSSIFIMKQLDFLLLGVDQLVNTCNILRGMNPKASFSIVAAVVDSGYEGPQSCLNSLSDFCALTRVPGYTIATKQDADEVFDDRLFEPGVRIICVSQRLLKSEFPDTETEVTIPQRGIQKHADGHDVTIASFNFSFPQARDILMSLRAEGRTASLYNVNAVLADDWTEIMKDAVRTGTLLIVDDSRSYNRPGDRLMAAMGQQEKSVRMIAAKREFGGHWYQPSPDVMTVDMPSLMREICNA